MTEIFSVCLIGISAIAIHRQRYMFPVRSREIYSLNKVSRTTAV